MSKAKRRYSRKRQNSGINPLFDGLTRADADNYSLLALHVKPPNKISVQLLSTRYNITSMSARFPGPEVFMGILGIFKISLYFSLWLYARQPGEVLNRINAWQSEIFT